MRAFLLHLMMNYKAWKTFFFAKIEQVVRARKAKGPKK